MWRGAGLARKGEEDLGTDPGFGKWAWIGWQVSWAPQAGREEAPTPGLLQPSPLPPGPAAGARLAAARAALGPAACPGPAYPAPWAPGLHLPPAPPPPATDAGSCAGAPGQVCRGGVRPWAFSRWWGRLGRHQVSRPAQCPIPSALDSPYSLLPVAIISA